ncbi:MAG: FAD synthase [Candidatus Micrarchaeota archaeon]|nr:FAD synthase [Candidatus Micrarchaeota archaeon]
MAGKSVVLAFGSFDILHPGHLAYLKRAKRLGDMLIVVVSRDSSIRTIKGREPYMDERARLEIVGSLRFVDKAVLGNRLKREADKYAIISRYMPDVLAFGYDQKINTGELREWLKSRGIKCRIARIRDSVSPRSFKSSRIFGRLS